MDGSHATGQECLNRFFSFWGEVHSHLTAIMHIPPAPNHPGPLKIVNHHGDVSARLENLLAKLTLREGPQMNESIQRTELTLTNGQVSSQYVFFGSISSLNFFQLVCNLLYRQTKIVSCSEKFLLAII